jgi:hypothetical protein
MLLVWMATSSTASRLCCAIDVLFSRIPLAHLAFSREWTESCWGSINRTYPLFIYANPVSTASRIGIIVGWNPIGRRLFFRCNNMIKSPLSVFSSGASALTTTVSEYYPHQLDVDAQGLRYQYRNACP